MPESQVSEVKSRIDIVGLISGYVNLKKAGRNYKGLCPFHGEKTPSFMVNPDRQIFKCFGCSEGGDVFEFTKKIEGVEFGEALKMLADKAGVRLKEYQPTPAEKQKEVINQINLLAANFYHYLLTKHPSGKKALAYLKGRGVNDVSIEDWLLGWAPVGWDEAFKFLSVKKKFTTGDIIAAGISLPGQRGGAYDRFRSRIMFPIRNTSGVVVGFSGRVLGEGEPKYLNSPDNMVFNKSSQLFGLDLAKGAIKSAKEAVLVEGNLDVLSSHQAGIKNVVAPLGTALTEKQIELIHRFSETLVISFDQDTAGQGAARRAIEMAEKIGLSVKLTDIGEKDPDDLIKKDPNLWKNAIETATPIYDYLINTTIKRYGTSTSSAINKITREVIPYLARIDNDITRSHYERVLASKLGVSEDAVSSELQKIGPRQVTTETAEIPRNNEKLLLEKYLLTLILQGTKMPTGLESSDVEEPKIRAILDILQKQVGSGKFKINDLVIPQELEETFNRATLLELPEEIVIDEDNISHEINSCVSRLKELNLRTRLKSLSLSIKQAEINKETEEVDNLTESFKVLSQQLSNIEKIKEG